MFTKLLCWIGMHEPVEVMEWVQYGPTTQLPVPKIRCKHCGGKV